MRSQSAAELLKNLGAKNCNMNCICQPCTADFDCRAQLPFSDVDQFCTNPLTSDDLHDTSDYEADDS